MTGPNRRKVLACAAAALTAAAMGPRRVNAADEHVVEIRALKFAPETLSVRPGDTVTWINRDIVPHTATAKDGSWDTGTLRKGESKSVPVTADMQPAYYCRFHPTMKARFA